MAQQIIPFLHRHIPRSNSEYFIYNAYMLLTFYAYPTLSRIIPYIPPSTALWALLHNIQHSHDLDITVLLYKPQPQNTSHLPFTRLNTPFLDKHNIQQ
jgi:hypothetical protein